MSGPVPATPPGPVGRHLWVKGLRFSEASYEPTVGAQRAFESKFAGLSDCFKFELEPEGCPKKLECTHGHARPWAVFELRELSDGWQKNVKHRDDITLEPLIDPREVRAIFKGERLPTVHPTVQIIDAMCRQNKLPRAMTLRQSGGGPTSWLDKTEFAFPLHEKAVAVTVYVTVSVFRGRNRSEIPVDMLMRLRHSSMQDLSHNNPGSLYLEPQ